MKFWIKDQIDTPQRFPLEKLFLFVSNGATSNEPEVWIERCRGYGATINKWDSELDVKDKLEVSSRLFQKIAKGFEEWFYDLDAIIFVGDSEVRFGLLDSNVMYVEGDERWVRKVVNEFENVQEVIE